MLKQCTTSYTLPSRRQWRLASPDPAATALANALEIHPVLAQVLWARGYDDVDSINTFLSPRLTQLLDPGGLADIGPAVKRIVKALSAGETIGVFGDYDVDGVTSTCLLSWFLRCAGAHVLTHIPHRLLDGYGLNVEGIEQLKQQGASLIITVDCGISDLAEVAAARRLGVDVIVVDHHTVGEQLPDAVAVLNPYRVDCTFGFRELAAVGVVFFLCAAVRRVLRETQPQGAGAQVDLRLGLDLVALGTIADQVPLVGQNRILVANGLKTARAGQRLGLQALAEVTGVDLAKLDAGHVAFQIAPRLNAAGRLGNASMALELLGASDEREAHRLALALDVANGERRQLENAVLKHCQHLLEGVDTSAGIVLGHADWHPGVLGIVASRLVERYGCPAVLVGEGGRGSGRSYAGINLFSVLSAVAHTLLTFGGHAQAVGVRADIQAIKSFRDAFVDEITRRQKANPCVETLDIEAVLPLRLLDLELVEGLKALEPCGRGNPKPVIEVECFTFRELQTVGVDHVRFILESEGHTASGIGFRMADRLDSGAFQNGARLAVIAEIDEWRGRRRCSLRAVDIVEPASGGATS